MLDEKDFVVAVVLHYECLRVVTVGSGGGSWFGLVWMYCLCCFPRFHETPFVVVVYFLWCAVCDVPLWLEIPPLLKLI